MNWDELCEHLQALTPPEVTHYYSNNHVGVGWYLHTVIPSETNHVIHKTWQHLQRTHADLIQISPHAYDWHAQLIPHACSVWFKSPHYVHVSQLWPSCDHEVWTQDQALNYWGAQIHTWSQSENATDASIHKLNHITQYMHTYTSAAQASEKRKQFRVIAHDQEDSGPAHPRSNMDPV